MNGLLDGRGRPRVVVTGMGAITPLGNTVDESWHSAVNGISGITEVTQFDASAMPSRVAGEIKGFDPRNYINFKEASRMSRSSQLATVISSRCSNSVPSSATALSQTSQLPGRRSS